MRKLLFASLLLFSFSSCAPGWEEESQQLFKQGCLESAKESNMETASAESMCNCRLEKAMKKYPDFSDAMNNLEKIMNDPEVKACK
jgi:hypothetical protein